MPTVRRIKEQESRAAAAEAAFARRRMREGVARPEPDRAKIRQTLWQMWQYCHHVRHWLGK